MSLTKVSYSMINGGPVNVLDFGAKNDGTVSSATSNAVSAALTYMFANNLVSLYFPAGTYYFATPVYINMDANGGIRIYGEGTSNFILTDMGGTKIIGAAGIESLFILTQTTLTNTGGYAFECEHIYFRSGDVGTTGPVAAIKNLVGGGPNRPFVVKNCGFTGFLNAIVSDLSSTGGLITGICQVIITENTFAGNNNALYGTGGLNCIMDLNFFNNVSEGGGSINITGLGGTCNISDNILEGQQNAIIINEGGYFALEIARNYFEENTNYIMQVSATNPYSSCYVHNNFLLNSANSVASFDNVFLICNDNFYQVGILFESSLLCGKSFINNTSVIYPDNASGSITLDYHCVPIQTSRTPFSLTGGAYVSGGGTSQVTPLGTTDVQTVTGLGSSQTPSLSLSTGDWVVAMCLARPVDLGATLALYVYNNANTPIGNGNTSFTIYQAATGEWVFLISWVQVSGPSSGNPHLRWVTSGGSVDFTSTYFYSISAPTVGTTPVYYCLPNP